MNSLPRLILVVALVASCAEQPTRVVEPAVSGDPHEETGLNMAWCRFDGLALHAPAASAKIKRASQAYIPARERYDRGFVVEYELRGSSYYESDQFPKNIRLALDLVADSLYAMILPKSGLGSADNPFHVRVGIRSLGRWSKYTLASAGSRFNNRTGLPSPGSARIEVNVEGFYNDNSSDPELLSSVGYWYVIIFHETLHTLGFGTSPVWTKQAKEGRNPKICGVRVSDDGHWDRDAFAFVNARPLMAPSRGSYYGIAIAPQTRCVLEDIGWELR